MKNNAHTTDPQKDYLVNFLQYTSISKPTPEAPVYDSDSNLIEDNRFTYTWDADVAQQRGDAICFQANGREADSKRVPFGRFESQNRLIKVETLSPSEGDPLVEFQYDYLSRRVVKKVSLYNDTSGEFESQTETKYLYDGWNVIEEQTTNLQSQICNLKSYLWGLDLSGTLQGAGGVGGLLQILDLKSGISNAYSVCYDANGNVTQLLDENGNIAAHYDYDPFGNTIEQYGSFADENTYRFSTKPIDIESGLYYYGYRYYNAANGRWINRDLIEERGGVNLYGFVYNAASNNIDGLGLFSMMDDTLEDAEANLETWRDLPSIAQRSDMNVSGSERGMYAIIQSALSPELSGSFSTSTLLAPLPGGSIELDVIFAGSIAPCRTKRDTIAFMFTGKVTVEVRGGFGYVLGNKNHEIRNPSNRKSHNNVYDKSKTGKEGKKPITGIYGKKHNPTLGGKSKKISLSCLADCKDDVDITVYMGSRFVAGAKFAGIHGDFRFGSIDKNGARWEFKPKGSVEIGPSPVGVRAELYGGGTADISITFGEIQ